MRTPRPVLLASAAAAGLAAAACSGDVTAPATPGITGVATVTPFHSTGGTAESDSVVAGYRSCGLDFGYDPDYAVCPDTTPAPAPAPRSLLVTGATSAGSATSRDFTGSTSGGSTGSGGSVTPQDSVQSGYGSGSTGGIDYDGIR